MIRRVAAMALLLAAGAALAIDPGAAFDDPALQARYEGLTNQLRCVKCQNQTVADSNAPVARDLRQQVREMIAAGASDDEILAFMTDRYGNFVRYRPPLTGTTAVLWAAPFLLLAGGLTIGVVLMVRKSRLVSDDDCDDAEAPGEETP